MIPQEGWVRAIKRLIKASGLKQMEGVKKEIILALRMSISKGTYLLALGSDQLDTPLVTVLSSEKRLTYA